MQFGGNMNDQVAHIKGIFEQRFGSEPVLVASPGRINLIGEHTDYNDGFVLPAAIDRHIMLAVKDNLSRSVCRVYAADLDAELTFDLYEDQVFPKGSWENYIIGCVMELRKADAILAGFDMTFSGNLPMGVGLSSSAALENAVVFGLNEVFGLELTRKQMIRISQLAEHNYAGVPCGIMDQFASMLGQEDHAIFLDCRTLESAYLPLDLDGYELLLINSKVDHSHASSDYKIRREECEAGLEIIQGYFPEAKALRDVTPAIVESLTEELPEVIYNRCLYVVRENLRVMNCMIALRSGQVELFGKYLFSAHNEMRYLFEITCPEIDFLAEEAKHHEDVIGSRMMGGGFGGCTLNLIRAGSGDSVKETLLTAYNKHFQIQGECLDIRIGTGTHLI